MYVSVMTMNGCEVKREHFEKAVEKISINLLSRYKISVKMIECTPSGMTLELTNVNKGFRIGNHLRGLSSFLLKNYPEYKEKRVGTSFLSFREISKPKSLDKDCDAIDCIEILDSILKLMKDNDVKSREKLRKIATFLKES